ncbi:WYL domain-containing protein [uncultured Flavobacterium sp.]|uniref:WYL domain-containing protein n=1 Tax=uncultured Flavobacterium sp. TaxID=165435 RepID=UPI00260269F0|nr:WYL domain-containing protein [uncultured Flavobacterium sp.]
MKKSKRISILLNQLKESKLSAYDLHTIFKNKNINISIRQIQRDINELENYLDKTEILDKVKSEKKIFYFISKKSKLNADKLNSIETFFYYPIENEIDTSINLFDTAINQRSTIIIRLIKNDLTGDNSNFEFEPFVFYPISIINHRNIKYIGGWNPQKKQIQIFGINQISEFSIEDKKFKMNKIKQKFHEELDKRFGVTKNIDENVYEIKIELSKVLANFIKSHYWHKTQKIIIKDNKTFLFLKCGINRELLGWLFQWMYNIRVIEPKILKDYYEKTIKEIQNNSVSKTPLVYRNIFIEKEK